MERVSPRCSGFGDLWDDVQNLQEHDKDSSVHERSVSNEKAEESNENSEMERSEESGDWRKSEEEENGDEEDNTEDEDKEEEKGTISSCGCLLFCATKFVVLWRLHTNTIFRTKQHF